MIDGNSIWKKKKIVAAKKDGKRGLKASAGTVPYGSTVMCQTQERQYIQMGLEDRGVG